MAATGLAPRGRRGGGGVRSAGDRPWAETGASTIAGLADEVRRRAAHIRGEVGIDAVHDLRTATRRLRTTIGVYGEDADQDERQSVERALKRAARRLGAVRDLDVLLEALADASGAASGGVQPIHASDLEPLRDAWRTERRAGAVRLKREIARNRFRKALDRAEALVGVERPADDGPAPGVRHRIATRAPKLIWASLADLLAYEIDPRTADPAVIHELRIAAKKLRYTLEVFEDALEPGPTLIAEVTAIQDAGGEMHDAIVARERARSTIRKAGLRRRERLAIDAFCDLQDIRAEACRPVIARHLATVEGRAFRDSLAGALAGMGHVVPVG